MLLKQQDQSKIEEANRLELQQTITDLEEKLSTATNHKKDVQKSLDDLNNKVKKDDAAKANLEQ